MRPTRSGSCALLCFALAITPLAAQQQKEPPYKRALSGKDKSDVEALLASLDGPQKADVLRDKITKIVAIRSRAQGDDHWQTIDARQFLADFEWRLIEDNDKKWQQAMADQDAVVKALEGGKPADPAAAAELMRKVLAVRKKVLPEGHYLTAEVQFYLGFCLLAHDKPAEAEEPILASLKARRKALGEDHPKTASSYFHVGVTHALAGRHAQAADYFKKAAEIHTRTQGPDHKETLTALAHHEAALSRLPRKPADDAETEKNILARIRARLDKGIEDAVTADLYQQLSFFYSTRGRHAEAEEPARKALAIHLRLQGDGHRATALSSSQLGTVLGELGRFAEAEPLLRKAVPPLREGKKKQDPELAIVCTNLAAHLHRQGENPAAERLLREALTAAGGLPDTNEIKLNILNNLAVVLASQGKLAEAERQFEAVSKAAKGSLVEAYAATSLGTILFVGGNYDRAEKLFELARDTFEMILGEGHQLTALSQYNVAGCRLFDGKARDALPLHRQAWASMSKSLGADHPETLRAGSNLAANLYALGQPDEAEAILLQLTSRFETARLRAGSTGLRRAVFAGTRSPWPALAALQARRGKSADAWQSLENALARGLFDEVSARQARPLEAKDRQREQELLTGLRVAENRIASLPDSPEHKDRLASLRKERDALLASLSQFEADLDARYGVVVGKPYPLDRIQAKLPADAALVMWLEYPGLTLKGTPTEHWACVVRRKGDPVWVRLTGAGQGGAWTAEEEGLRERVRAAISAPTSGRDWADLRARTAKLYLGPLAEHLAARGDLPAVKQLIALTYEVPVDFLAGDELAVSYAPSATLFAWLLERREEARARPRRQGAPTLLALGDPFFHGLGRLKGTGTEARAIAELFDNPTLLLGKDATREAVDQKAAQKELQTFDFIHLATHGVADAHTPMQSAILLPHSGSGTGPGDGPHDSRLTAERILQTWKLDAELVTLSACESAGGRDAFGEGYLGLSQALLLAGGRSLVLSLWKVDDEATALLMRRFYQNLRGGRPRAQALAEARRWLASLSSEEAKSQGKSLPRSLDAPITLPKENASGRPYDHPYYWAPFVLVGDPGDVPAAGPKEAEIPVPSSTGGGKGLWLTLTLVAVLGAGAAGVIGVLALRRVRGRRLAPPPLPPAAQQPAVAEVPSAAATSGFHRTETGVFFWFGGAGAVKSVGPILRFEPAGEGRYYLFTQAGRHPIRLSQGQVAELRRLLGHNSAAG